MYKISIIKVESVPCKTKEWVKLFDYTEVEEKLTDWAKGQRPEQYGYKEIDGIKKIETQVLLQELEEINVINVVKAINNI